MRPTRRLKVRVFLYAASWLVLTGLQTRGVETLYNGIVLPESWPPNIRTIGIAT